MCTKIGPWPIPIFRFSRKMPPWGINRLFRNFASEYARHLILVSNAMFLRTRNYLRPFSEATDWYVGQGGDVGTVASQGTRHGGRIFASRSEILTLGVTQVLSMQETWFWWQNQCFGVWGIIWDHFQKPQIDLKPKNCVAGCRKSRRTSRSKILTWGVTQLLSMLETWFWWQNQCFGVWGIIWDHFQRPPTDLKA